MKNFIKKISSFLSLILVIAISFMALTACSKSNDTESENTITTAPITDTSTAEDEKVADEVSDEDENLEEESTTEENTDQSDDKTTEEPTLSTLSNSIFKFQNEKLTLSDIYYYDESELFDYFKTTDLNGVYYAVKELGFDSFANQILSFEENGETYNKSINLKINSNEPSSIIEYYYNNDNEFTSIKTLFTFDITENNEITTSDDCYVMTYNAESNTISIAYRFTYINESTGEVEKTPLFIKTNLYCYEPLEFTQTWNSYSLIAQSATIESKSEAITQDEGYANLAKLINISQEDLLTTLSECTLIVSPNQLSKLYITYNSTLILTEKVENADSFRVHNSFNIDIISEDYNIDSESTTLNIQIVIDENTTFKCTLLKNAA